MYKYVLCKISAVLPRNLSIFSGLEYVKNKLQSIFKYIISSNGHITDNKKRALFPSPDKKTVSGLEVK